MTCKTFIINISIVLFFNLLNELTILLTILIFIIYILNNNTLGDDSVWTLLNYDFCIICLQILKYFTVYNYAVLDIYYHKPSIVKTVIEKYTPPDNSLQSITVTSGDQESHTNRKQHKYNTKRSLFDRIFKRGKDVGEFDNDENVVLIVKDNELIDEEEEEQQQSPNNINDLSPLSLQDEITPASSSSAANPLPPQNESSSLAEAKLIEPSTSSSIPPLPSKKSNPTASLPSSSSSSGNIVNDLIDPLEGSSSLANTTNNPIKSKSRSKLSISHKGKSRSQSFNDTASLSSKGKAPEDPEDVFYDAYDQSLLGSSEDSFPPSSINTPPIPLRHVHSSSLFSHRNSEGNGHTTTTSTTTNNNNNSNDGGEEAGTSSSSTPNEIPIYEIDERERVTEGNDNALLYLESYYQFVPVITIQVHEALQVMRAIRQSNHRFWERKKREERREQRRQEREQRRQEREQRRQERDQHRLSSTSSILSSLQIPDQLLEQLQQQGLVREPESEVTSETQDEGTERSSTTNTNRRRSSTQPQDQEETQSISSRSSVVSTQLRSYFNGLHNSFRRSLTGVPPV